MKKIFCLLTFMVFVTIVTAQTHVRSKLYKLGYAERITFSDTVSDPVTIECNSTITMVQMIIDDDVRISLSSASKPVIGNRVIFSIGSSAAKKITFGTGFRANADSSIEDAYFNAEFVYLDTAFYMTANNLKDVTELNGSLELANGLTIDNSVNNVLEFNENSDELKYTFGSNTVTVSSTDVTSFVYSMPVTFSSTATVTGTINGLTIANGINRLVTTATAYEDSTVEGCLLGSTNQYVTVTSGAATRIILLPATTSSTVGMVIEGWVGSNGFNLRVKTADRATVYLNNAVAAGGVEAAIPANTKFMVTCTSATTWLLTCVTNAGVVLTAIVPDAIN